MPLLLEYESVAKRPELGLPFSSEEIDDFIDSLCAVGRNHAIFFLWRPQLRDPGDEMVLEVAVTGRCEYIVTYNLRDFAGSEKLGVRAITPMQFLRMIGERI